MKFLALLATLLLSLVGYSSGVVLKSHKAGVRKPVFFDLALVFMMWAGIVFSFIRAGLSKGLLLAIWVASGFLLGGFVTAFKRSSAAAQMSAVEPRLETRPVRRKRFQPWRAFSARIGSFQSLVILGILFLVVFVPVGLVIRFFGDPLRLKGRGGESHWTPKKPLPADLERFKRQS